MHEAREAFREQISVLWEAGADLLLFETFVDLAELEIAVQVARAGLRSAHRRLHDLCRRWADHDRPHAAEVVAPAARRGRRRGGRQLLGRPGRHVADAGATARGRAAMCCSASCPTPAFPNGWKVASTIPPARNISRGRRTPFWRNGARLRRRLLRHHAHAHPRDAHGAGRAGWPARSGQVEPAVARSWKTWRRRPRLTMALPAR